MSAVRLTGPAGTLALDDGARDGIPVVLAHSLAGTTAHWSRQLEHLRTERRAVAVDFRGHGASDPSSSGTYTLAGLADDLGAAVDHLEFGKFALVGHSMGAGVALSYVAAHPQRIAALLLLDPIGDGTQIPAAEATAFLEGLSANYESVIQGYWSQIAGPDPAVKQRLLADLRATPREAVVQLFRAVLQFDPGPLLSAYQGPIMSIVTPQNDQPFSLHRLGAGFPHKVISGTGHWIQLDRPELINQLLDEFLEQGLSQR